MESKPHPGGSRRPQSGSGLAAGGRGHSGNRKALWVLLLLFVVVALAACAPGVNPEVGVPPDDGNVAGFWAGLWHGLIAPITFIISLFTDTVSVYEVHNTGNWYDFGFVLGAGILFGGGTGGARSRRR